MVVAYHGRHHPINWIYGDKGMGLLDGDWLLERSGFWTGPSRRTPDTFGPMQLLSSHRNCQEGVPPCVHECCCVAARARDGKLDAFLLDSVWMNRDSFSTS